VGQLEANSDGPYVFNLQRSFLADNFSFVPGFVMPGAYYAFHGESPQTVGLVMCSFCNLLQVLETDFPLALKQ
jgi:hypothetical protein